MATSIAEQIYKRNQGEESDPQFATFCALALVFAHAERYFGPWSNYGNGMCIFLRAQIQPCKPHTPSYIEAGHSSTADEPHIGPLADLFRQLLILGGWDLVHTKDQVFKQSLSILVDALKNLQNHFELQDITDRWRLVFVRHGMEWDGATMTWFGGGEDEACKSRKSCGASGGGGRGGSEASCEGAGGGGGPKVAAQIRLGVRAIDGRADGISVPMATIVTEEQWMGAYD